MGLAGLLILCLLLPVQVQTKAEEMETGQKLKDAGLQNDKIDSDWGSSSGREGEVGEVKFIPRLA